jgi:HlyD family secretion protein
MALRDDIQRPRKASASAMPVAPRSRAAEPVLPAVLEFQWPSTAISNAPSPRSARGTIWVITSMVLALIAVTAMIPVDQVVTARGVIVGQSPTILVQPLETAIVRSIDVREGQEVKAGQVLARLDPTFAAADLATSDSQVSKLEADVARLRAEAAGKPFGYAGHDPDWLVQASIYTNRKAEYDAKIATYRHRNDELDATISRAQSDAAGYQERLALAEQREQMRTSLANRQLGTKGDALAAQDTRAEMARSLANSEQTAISAKQEQAALASERDTYEKGWLGDVSQNLAEENGKLADAREQANKAKLRRQMVELRSERDAIVQSVSKVSVGSVLQSGEQFITLVPTDTGFEVEANIRGRDDGFVHVGDPVAIKFDTFPYTQYGMAEGSVRVVSPDSFTAQDEARNPTSAVPVPETSSEPFYRTRIAINRMALHDVPDGFHVTPGMPVTADVKVGKRTVLGYLLGRILPVVREGMREP